MLVLVISIIILLFLYIAGYGVVKLVLPRVYWNMLYIFPPVGLAFIIWLATLLSSIGFGTDKFASVILILVILFAIIGYKKTLTIKKDSFHECLEEQDINIIDSNKSDYNFYFIVERFIAQHENKLLLLTYFIGIVFASMPIILKEYLTTFSWGNGDPIAYVIVAKYLMTHGCTIVPKVMQYKPIIAVINQNLTGSTRPGIFLIIAVMSSLFKLDPFQLFSVLLAVLYSLIGPLVYIFTLKCMKASRTTSIIAALVVIINCNLMWVVYNGLAGQLSAYSMFFVALILFIITIEDNKILNGAESIKQLIPEILIIGLIISALYSLYPESTVLLFAIMAPMILRYLLIKDIRPLIIFIFIIIISIIFNPYLVIATARVLISTLSIRPGWDLPKYALLTEAVGIYPLVLWDKVNNIYSIIISLFILYIMLIKNQKRIYIMLSVLLPLGSLMVWQGIVLHYSYGYFKSLTVYLPYVLIFFTIGLIAIIFNNVAANKAYGKFLSYMSKALALACLFMMLLTGIFTTYTVSKNCLILDQNTIDLGSISRLLPQDEPIYIEAPANQNYWLQLWSVYFLNRQDLYLNWMLSYLGGIKASQPTLNKYILVRLTGAGNNDILSNTLVLLSGNAIFKNDLYEILLGGEQDNIANITWEDTKADTIYAPEGNYRWMNNDAVLQITMPKAGEYVIICELYPGPGNPLLYRHLQVFQDNNIVDEYYVSNDDNSYELGPFMLKQGVNDIKFHVVEPVNVFKQGNGDTRMLNMMIKNPTFYQFIPYEYGSLIQFNNNGNYAQQYQGQGWSYPEKSWTWTDGHLATLMIPVKKSDNDLKLKINIATIIALQRVGIMVNGGKITEITVNKPGEYDVTIPKTETNNSLLKLTFELPDAVSPHDLNISVDPRTLGIGVQSITIQ